MSTDNHRPEDHELDEFLSGRSTVSREYHRLGKASAPAPLDAAVLRLAHEAAASPRRARLERWRVPLALAATVLLSLGSLQLLERDPEAQRVARFEAVMPHAPEATVLAEAASPPPLAADVLPLRKQEQKARAKPVAPAAAPLPPPGPAPEQELSATQQAELVAGQVARAQQRSAEERHNPAAKQSPPALAFAAPSEMRRSAAAASGGAPRAEKLEKSEMSSDAGLMQSHADAAPGRADVMADGDGAPAHSDAPVDPVCIPALPEDFAGCYARVRQLRDQGRLDEARALLQSLERLAVQRGQILEAVPEDLKSLQLPATAPR